jgi:hypothetical protein
MTAGTRGRIGDRGGEGPRSRLLGESRPVIVSDRPCRRSQAISLRDVLKSSQTKGPGASACVSSHRHWVINTSS